MCKRLGTLAF